MVKTNSIEPSFWLQDPAIVLYMIRMVIWLNSTEFGTTIFFIVKTGIDGCYVSQRSWLWIIINTVVTTLVAIHCAYNVIPLYSLTSNLGSHRKKTDHHIEMKIAHILRKTTLNTFHKKSSSASISPEPSEKESLNSVSPGH